MKKLIILSVLLIVSLNVSSQEAKILIVERVSSIEAQASIFNEVKLQKQGSCYVVEPSKDLLKKISNDPSISYSGLDKIIAEAPGIIMLDPPLFGVFFKTQKGKILFEGTKNAYHIIPKLYNMQ